MRDESEQSRSPRGRAPRGKPVEDAAALDGLELNKKIIELLQKDGRMAYSSIASIVGVSEGTVRNRVRQLIDDNVITIQAEALPNAFGYTFNAMTFLKVAPGADIERVARRLSQVPEVYYLTMILGRFDLGMATFHKSQDDFRAFLTEHCYGRDDIAEVENNLILKVHKVKMQWNLADGGEG
jgi:Lrp/AsnC family transcriptional regulator for asnA, asnC and gidA